LKSTGSSGSTTTALLGVPPEEIRRRRAGDEVAVDPEIFRGRYFGFGRFALVG
jgi:hypothetical protein